MHLSLLFADKRDDNPNICEENYDQNLQRYSEEIANFLII